MGDRKALVVATDEYQDAKLRRLRAPSEDAAALADVLGSAAIGAFSVSILSNQVEHVLRRQVSAFFREASRDDFLLLHFACHGVKDEDGRLYFAATDTEVTDLAATAVSSEFVSQAMFSSRSTQIVLFLDCCYSGAFSKGMLPRADDAVQLKERLHGRGRAVITSSDSTEYAWEGDELKGQGMTSVFTRAVVEGLESGEADLDLDGQVSIDELYDYVSQRIESESSRQTPRKWNDLAGDLYIALNPRAEELAVLPIELAAAIENPIPAVRMGIVDELGRLVGGSHAGFAIASRRALQDLANNDDSRSVRSAAESKLSSLTMPTESVREPIASVTAPASGTDEPASEPGGSMLPTTAIRADPTPTPRSRSVEGKAGILGSVAAFVAAALLTIAFFIPDFFGPFTGSLNDEPVYWAGILTAAAGAIALGRMQLTGWQSSLSPFFSLGLSLWLAVTYAYIIAIQGVSPARPTLLILTSSLLLLGLTLLSRRIRLNAQARTIGWLASTLILSGGGLLLLTQYQYPGSTRDTRLLAWLSFLVLAGFVAAGLRSSFRVPASAALLAFGVQEFLQSIFLLMWASQNSENATGIPLFATGGIVAAIGTAIAFQRVVSVRHLGRENIEST